MKTTNSRFFAKILLFGEYSVICDSMGLTIPYAHFEGNFSFINKEDHTDYDYAIRSNRDLKNYADHLTGLLKEDQELPLINIDRLQDDISNGLYFRSTIPQGYGIGSSGALVAALYDRYSEVFPLKRQQPDTESIPYLKHTFSRMESYFHGTSSGLDPLLCYLQRPLLIRNKTDIQFVNIPPNQFSKEGAIFLLDSGKPGKTQPLVQHFLGKCSTGSFREKIKSELIPYNDQCINSLLRADTETFTENLQKLSDFQLRHFSPMIPGNFRNIWENGLANGKYSMKLCGSGGGGFILAFANRYEPAVHDLQKMGVDFITVYKNSAHINSASFIFV